MIFQQTERMVGGRRAVCVCHLFSATKPIRNRLASTTMRRKSERLHGELMPVVRLNLFD